MFPRYDNTYKKMFAHVRVSGPAFKKVPEVENIPVIMNTEMYNLYCSLLGSFLSAVSIPTDQQVLLIKLCVSFSLFYLIILELG